MKEVHCCGQMADRLKDETAILYVPKFREYGVSVLDGGTGFIVIQFCPWCGSRLPSSLRDQWFDHLSDRGFEVDAADIPDEYSSDAWWKSGQTADEQ